MVKRQKKVLIQNCWKLLASASYSPEFRPFSSHIKSAHSEIDFSAVLGMETGKGKFLALDSSTMMITIEIKIIRIARWVEVDVNDVQKIDAVFLFRIISFCSKKLWMVQKLILRTFKTVFVLQLIGFSKVPRLYKAVDTT